VAATDRDGPVVVIGPGNCLVAQVTDLDGLAVVIGLDSCLADPATDLDALVDLETDLDGPVAPATDLVSVTDLDARAIGLGDLATDLDGLVVGISISTVAGSMRILGTGTTTSTSGIGRSVPTGGVAIRRDSGMPTTIPGVTVVFAPVAGGAGPRPAR
jgi:hypothetical protein